MLNTCWWELGEELTWVVECRLRTTENTEKIRIGRIPRCSRLPREGECLLALALKIDVANSTPLHTKQATYFVSTNLSNPPGWVAGWSKGPRWNWAVLSSSPDDVKMKFWDFSLRRGGNQQRTSREGEWGFNGKDKNSEKPMESKNRGNVGITRSSALPTLLMNVVHNVDNEPQ